MRGKGHLSGTHALFFVRFKATFNGRNGFTFGLSELGYGFAKGRWGGGGGWWTSTDVSRDTVFYYNDSPLFVLFCRVACRCLMLLLLLLLLLGCHFVPFLWHRGCITSPVFLTFASFPSHGADGVGPRRFKFMLCLFPFPFVTYCVVLGCFMHSTRSGRWYIVQRLVGRALARGWFKIRCS